MNKMKKVINKMKSMLNYLGENGLADLLILIIRKISGKMSEIECIKEKIHKNIVVDSKYEVKYGLFKGVRLSVNVWWSKYDQISKILGCYESTVVKEINYISEVKRGVFIDVGAADGYYAAGVACNKVFEKVFAYDINPISKLCIKECVEINKCEHLVEINSRFDLDQIKKIKNNYEIALVLVDIEGEEYDLLDDEILFELKYSYLLIELHPWLVNDGINKERLLIERVKKSFNYKFVCRDHYECNIYEELSQYSDDERLIALSENREKNMRWLVLYPRDIKV